MSPFRIKGTSGPVLNQVFGLGEDLVVGGANSSGQVLEGLPVPGDALRLTLDNGVVTLSALDPDCPVFLNGDAVTTTTLNPGDELRIGACRFILQAPGRRPERVLDEAAIRQRGPAWPWWLAAALAAAAALAWWQGWIGGPVA